MLKFVATNTVTVGALIGRWLIKNISVIRNIILIIVKLNYASILNSILYTDILHALKNNMLDIGGTIGHKIIMMPSP